MSRGKLAVFVLLTALLTVVAVPAFPNSAASGQSQGSGQSASPEMVIKGKIHFMERVGRYIVQTQNPPGELFVANENLALLKKLAASQKILTIEGHITMDADHFFIEKIDGKTYLGDTNR